MAGATAGFIALGGLARGLFKRHGEVTVPWWAIALAGALGAELVLAAFLVGMSRRVAPTANRLAGELGVANGYLFQADDFMSTFREVVSVGDPAAVLEELPCPRDVPSSPSAPTREYDHPIES